VVRLAHAGLIEPVETSREGRRPERTVYRITPQGSDLTDLLETPPAEAAPFAIALSFLAYVPPRAAVVALHKRAFLLEGQIAALDAEIQALARQFGMPRLALVEEEWNRAQRQAERDFTLRLVDAIHEGSVTWDITWDEVNPFDPPSARSLSTTPGDHDQHDQHDRDSIPDRSTLTERHPHRS
jgi:DNA-binding PadR family transcriptional regulator